MPRHTVAAEIAARTTTPGGFVAGPDLLIPAGCVATASNLFVLQRDELNVVQRSRSGERTLDTSALTRAVLAGYLDELHGLLPNDVAAPRIVDIGAGLGMYHVFVDRRYNSRAEHFLVDKSMVEVQHGNRAQSGFWHADRLPFYNSVECAKAIAVANGVHASRWHATEASSAGVEALGAGTVDIAISLLSCGWHYPVTAYAAALAHVLKPTVGRLILTIRRGKGQEQLLWEAGFYNCSRSLHWRQRSRGFLVTCFRGPTPQHSPRLLLE